MEYFPAALEKLVEQFARLPGIGGKSAQRLAFHVLSLTDAVRRYMGRRRSSARIMASGLRSKLRRTAASSLSSSTAPVPNVSINTDTGSATPIA